MCPTQNMLIGIGRIGTTNLSAWQDVMNQQGCITGMQEINGISTVFGVYHDSDGYDVSFYFTEGVYSYKRPYNNTDDETNWAECSLRRWLNDDFLNEAFTFQHGGCVLWVLMNLDQFMYLMAASLRIIVGPMKEKGFDL